MVKNQPRWGRRIFIAFVTLALLGGAAELALRLIIPGVISAQVRESLQLTDDHPVETTLGGSALLNAITGHVGDVTVAVLDTPVGAGIVANLSLHADSVPFDVSGAEISGGTARVTVPQEGLSPVVELLTRGIATSGTIESGELIVGRSVEIFGQSIPIQVNLTVAVEDGNVLLRPQSVNVVGLALTTDQLSSATGTLLDPILKPEPICVREALPAGVTLTEISLSSTGSVSVDVDLSAGILSDLSQREAGSCT